MNKHKVPAKDQKYENYWKLTVEYSDIHGDPFSSTLEIILNFIDKHKSLLQNPDKREFTKLYKKLQTQIEIIYPKKDSASTRKSINQFVKLGFIEPLLKGYKPESKKFLLSTDDESRSLIFSEIYYKYSTLNSSVTNDFTNYKQISFLLKTLMYHPEKELKKEEIIALMTVDIAKIKKGYLNETELKQKVLKAEIIEFITRKYNQINYFMNYLKFIPGIKVMENKSSITYTEDASIQWSDKIDLSRDPLMFRIMKEKIKQESIELYGSVQCYLTKREQKGLVVSHIWRSSEALKSLNVEAAYDYNNALLLEPTTDQYFDKYDITFKKDGSPLFNNEVPTYLKESLGEYTLDEKVLNSKRLEYLLIHNQYFEKKHSND